MSNRILTSLAMSVAALFACSSIAQAQDKALIERGAYVARAGDCAACHRTVEPGGADYVGGYVIKSPMGDIVAPNITPSKKAGIGNWTFADFDRAMRKGKRPDGANLYPAMPYTDYQGISDADMRALYAYFMQGVKPVDTVAPKTQLPFPFGIRMIMTPWNWMFRSDKPFKAQADLDAKEQRGQYLVETLGHCGSCHTERNILMAEKSSQALGGGDLGGWHAPNITSDPISGIGGWSEAEIVAYMRDGRVPGKGIASGGMAEAVEHSLRHLTNADLAAMAAYLKVSKPIRDKAETKPSFSYTDMRPLDRAAYEPGNGPDRASYGDGSSTDGSVLYAGACASCHGLNGKGTADHFYPTLVGSSTTGAINPANLIMTILEGVNRESGSGHAFMPAFAHEMNDDQIAAVSNHVLKQFGRADTNVTAAMVATARDGGAKPLLLQLMPFLLALAAAALIVMGWLVIRRTTRGAVVAR
jgi:mono/diheme cytochrome c family protein